MVSPVDRPCGSVGRPMRLRVLSLNVWGLPSPVGHLVPERLAVVLQDLAKLDCDVALFQEVWTDEGRTQLVLGAHRLGFVHAFYLPGPARGASGLLAVSKLPISGTDFRPFTLCGLPQRFTQMDYYSGKGVARIDVEVGGIPVAILNTHLHARYAPAKKVDAYRGHRTAEVLEIAESLSAERGAVIAVGDFNMQDTSPEYRVLLGLTGLRDAAATLDVRQTTATLENVYRLARGAKNAQRIDYVFCRDGRDHGVRAVTCERVFNDTREIAGEPGAASDHAGLVSEIEVGGMGSPPPPVTEDVFALAQVLLDTGRDIAERRRLFERASAGVSLAAAGGAVWSVRQPRLSRRRFLRSGLVAGAAVASLSAGGLVTLSERFVPEEFAGFDEAEATLSRLRDGTTRRPA